MWITVVSTVTSALSILRAALEHMAGDAVPDSNGNCVECRWPITLVGLLDVHSADCKSWQARAALEAAAKAPALSDDVGAIAHAFEAVLDHVDNRPEVADACAKDVLRAVDAYQRGGR